MVTWMAFPGWLIPWALEPLDLGVLSEDGKIDLKRVG